MDSFLRQQNGEPTGGWRVCVALTVWCYVTGVLLTWLLIAWAGDRWWLATVMLFGPRWVYALPLVVLLPLALVTQRRLLALLLPAAVVCLGPIAQYHVPWQGPWEPSGNPRLRVLTCNVEGWTYGSEQALRKVIQRVRPDIVMLQEHCDEVPPIWPHDWSIRTSGRLLIASRFHLAPMDTPDCQWRSMPQNYPDALACVVNTPHGNVSICNIHLETPREGLEPVLCRRMILRPSGAADLHTVIRYREEQSRQVRAFADETFQAGIIAGDFNMPTDGAIYRRYWSDYTNTFQRAGWGYGYTKWSQIRFLNYGLRIDHILTSSAWRPLRCWVEEDVHSDHRPVVADIEFTAEKSRAWSQ